MEKRISGFIFFKKQLTDLTSKLPLALDSLTHYTNKMNLKNKTAVAALFCEPSATKRSFTGTRRLGCHTADAEAPDSEPPSTPWHVNTTKAGGARAGAGAVKAKGPEPRRTLASDPFPGAPRCGLPKGTVLRS